MSVLVFFAFSQGLTSSIKVPFGTLAHFMAHVASVEAELGLRAETYCGEATWRRHWTAESKRFDGISHKQLCDAVRKHNDWVRTVYRQLARWSENPPEKAEELTTENAQLFWHALELLDVPVSRWTEEHYVDRMQHAYAVMRGDESEGTTFDARKLSPEQAGAVIRLFEQWIGAGDPRLEVPKGHDLLVSSDEYVWCSTCGRGAFPDDALRCRKRGCEARACVRDERNA